MGLGGGFSGGVICSHSLVDRGGDEFRGVLDLLGFVGRNRDARMIFFPCDAGGVFRGHGAQADEELDTFGDRDIEVSEFVFRDEHEEAGGGIGGCGEEDTEHLWA